MGSARTEEQRNEIRASIEQAILPARRKGWTYREISLEAGGGRTMIGEALRKGTISAHTLERVRAAALRLEGRALPSKPGQDDPEVVAARMAYADEIRRCILPVQNMGVSLSRLNEEAGVPDKYLFRALGGNMRPQETHLAAIKAAVARFVNGEEGRGRKAIPGRRGAGNSVYHRRPEALRP